ncbi:MAG: hypothetical protein ACPGVD_06800, partial [Flavobacteriales bacterium]
MKLNLSKIVLLFAFLMVSQYFLGQNQTKQETEIVNLIISFQQNRYSPSNKSKAKSDIEKAIEDSLSLIEHNRIFHDRTQDVGVIDQEFAINAGITGP